MELSPRYNLQEVEDKWYKFLEKIIYFPQNQIRPRNLSVL